MIKVKLFYSSLYIIGQIGKILGFNFKNPIFIIGTGRCGTTLLSKILRSHNQISVFPNEGNELWHPKLHTYTESKIEAPPILVNPKLFTEISLKNWSPKHKNFIECILTGFRLLKSRSNFFVIKSAMISFMISDIINIFPDAKFIHIYRNGVSVAESLFKKEKGKYLSLFSKEEDFRIFCANYWKSCILEIDRLNDSLLLTHRKILYNLRYEDLCENPKMLLNNLFKFIGCNFRGLNFDLSMIKNANYKVGDYYKNEKWLKTLKIIGPLLIEKGYNSLPCENKAS